MMTLHSGHSGRSTSRNVRPVAADYNLEHAPLRSDKPVDESAGTGLLRGLTGSFGSDRYSAGILLLILMVVVVLCFILMTDVLTNTTPPIERRDPEQSAREATPTQGANLQPQQATPAGEVAAPLEQATP